MKTFYNLSHLNWTFFCFGSLLRNLISKSMLTLLIIVCWVFFVSHVHLCTSPPPSALTLASSLLDLAEQSASLHSSSQTKDPSTEILDEELLALGTNMHCVSTHSTACHIYFLIRIWHFHKICVNNVHINYMFLVWSFIIYLMIIDLFLFQLVLFVYLSASQTEQLVL